MSALALILAYQNGMAVRHGDETGWRIQSLGETGRSRRAWLWISVSKDAVYFHIDPSRSAEAAMKLFGSVKGTVFLVCDRYVAYTKMARELDDKVILCWCWIRYEGLGGDSSRRKCARKAGA